MVKITGNLEEALKEINVKICEDISKAKTLKQLKRKIEFIFKYFGSSMNVPVEMGIRILAREQNGLTGGYDNKKDAFYAKNTYRKMYINLDNLTVED